MKIISLYNFKLYQSSSSYLKRIRHLPRTKEPPVIPIALSCQESLTGSYGTRLGWKYRWERGGEPRGSTLVLMRWFCVVLIGTCVCVACAMLRNRSVARFRCSLRREGPVGGGKVKSAPCPLPSPPPCHTRPEEFTDPDWIESSLGQTEVLPI